MFTPALALLFCFALLRSPFAFACWTLGYGPVRVFYTPVSLYCNCTISELWYLHQFLVLLSRRPVRHKWCILAVRLCNLGHFALVAGGERSRLTSPTHLEKGHVILGS